MQRFLMIVAMVAGFIGHHRGDRAAEQAESNVINSVPAAWVCWPKP
ncbi:MAG: hypothetical protein R2856_00600 [Caldilineaceae bacterium]